MTTALGLDPLLAALREAGLPVGVAEVARLQQVFALGPQLAMPGDRRLKAILRAALVKSAEDRSRFEPVFDAWLGRASSDVSLRETSTQRAKRAKYSTSPPLLARQPKPPRKSRRSLAFAALCLLCLSLGNHAKWAPWTPEKLPLTPSEIRKRSFTAWIPVLTVESTSKLPRGMPAFALGSLAFIAAGALWIASRRWHWLPKPESKTEPDPVAKGPPRVFLTPPQLKGPQLLEPRDQEALVWGITHFLADEPTHRLDLRTTVRKTAQAGGIPHLIHHKARHPREVWLWIDEAAEDPSIVRIASEVEASLRAHALPIEVALFRGIPDWLVESNGQSFSPSEIDERRDTALVAILTDGHRLVRHYAADDRRVKIEALLRSLSRWPRLAIVDFGSAPGDLAAILAKHTLPRILPTQLTSFLGFAENASPSASFGNTGDSTWAAACALAPVSIDEPTAFELRLRLGLKTSPWAIRALRAEAPGIQGRLHWRAEDRAKRINWLRESEAQPRGGIAPDSLLGKALRFWEDTYDRELGNREGRPHQETRARQGLNMEHALVALWRDAPAAIARLYQMYRSSLREIIKRQLREMAPLDWGGGELVHLPWSWNERSPYERLMLQEMGLGGGMPPVILQRPGRLWLSLGVCLGLAGGTLSQAVFSGLVQPEARPTVQYDSEAPVDAWHYEKSSRSGTWYVTVGTRKSLAQQEVPAGAEVNVQWERRALPCFTQSKDIEVWRCGTTEPPLRPGEDSRMKITMLVRSPGAPYEDKVAIFLLDNGVADLVIVGTKAPQSVNLIDTSSQLRIVHLQRAGDLSKELAPR